MSWLNDKTIVMTYLVSFRYRLKNFSFCMLDIFCDIIFYDIIIRYFARSHKNKRRTQWRNVKTVLEILFKISLWRVDHNNFLFFSWLLYYRENSPHRKFRPPRDDVATRTRLRGNYERPDTPSDVRILRSPTFARNRIFIRTSPGWPERKYNILIATLYYSPCGSFWLFRYLVFFYSICVTVLSQIKDEILNLILWK